MSSYRVRLGDKGSQNISEKNDEMSSTATIRLHGPDSDRPERHLGTTVNEGIEVTPRLYILYCMISMIYNIIMSILFGGLQAGLKWSLLMVNRVQIHPPEVGG
jgi:hypothetical protein